MSTNFHACILDDMRNPEVSWQWQKSGVLDYDSKTKRWLVQKVDADDKITCSDKKPLVNGGLLPNGTFCKSDAQYWIPKIQLAFLAEDPSQFAARVASAYFAREATEAGIRYNLYLDCMPVDGLVQMSESAINNITYLAKDSTPVLKSVKG